MTHSQDKSSALGQGVVIFVYLAVLTIIEYFIAVAFDAVPLLLVVAVIKAGLVMYYYMHIYKLNQNDGDDQNSYEYKSGTNRIGLWLFLLSDSFVFAGLMVMRVNLLGLTRPHLNQLLGLVSGGRPGEAVRQLDQFTGAYLEHFGKLAIRYHVNVIVHKDVAEER